MAGAERRSREKSRSTVVSTPVHDQAAEPSVTAEPTPPSSSVPQHGAEGLPLAKGVSLRQSTDHLDRREALLHVDAQMWRVRWLCAAFAFAQFSLYRPPPGVRVPFNALLLGSVTAAVVVVTNLVSLWARRQRDIRVLSAAGTGQLVMDGIVVLSVVWLFSFDSQSALWALLILVVIEGALRAQLKGAIATWAGLSAGYIAREFWAASHFPNARVEIPSLTYRLGIILIVAAATGYLAKTLRERIREQRDSRRQSEQRALLLHTVAARGRALSAFDTDELFSSIVDATVQLGFDSAAMVAVDEGADSFRIAAHHGIPAEFATASHPLNSGLVSVVMESRDVVIIDDYSTWPKSRLELRPLGLNTVVGCPVFTGADIEAVLIAGAVDRNRITSDQRECIELLAVQGGAALTNIRRFKERQTLQEQLQHEALHDSLTGLPNRTLFLDRLNHCLERKARSATPSAVFFIDIDGFKRVNDSFGHAIGDELIQGVAKRLRAAVHIADTVARWAGEEFTVLIEEPETKEAAHEGAERILKEIRAPFRVNGRDVFLTASVGVAYGARLPGYGHELIREADVAMYGAKERGGDACEDYLPTMIARAERRMDLELQLRHALDHGMFAVHYQPAVNAQDGKIVGLEALVRWNHTTRGILDASEFIALAEERDLIIRLGDWVLNAVCEQIARWRTQHPNWPRFPIAVNLSAKELRQPDFEERVLGAVKRHGIKTEDIVFEITERALVDPEQTLDPMVRLRTYGLRFAIDDFGLGYSSLAYLKQFPFSILKMDRSFVAGVTHLETDQAIVRSVLTLAKDLSIPVVAEGVETQAQLDQLKAMGCQFVQGYLLYRPLAAEQIESLVAPATVPA
jgi:diguanylate cyclase (GGDEF)-like protein